jgi:biopolymer transport protein ExbD
MRSHGDRGNEVKSPVSMFSRSLKAEPNLTPILDMVFQLITFFMLVVNFKSAELDLNLKLPVVGSARPVDTKGLVGVLVLNIDGAGNLRTTRTIQNLENFIRTEAQAVMFGAHITADDLARGQELPTTIVIRADRGASFMMVNRVIRECRKNGFRNFALKALDKEK